MRRRLEPAEGCTVGMAEAGRSCLPGDTWIKVPWCQNPLEAGFQTDSYLSHAQRENYSHSERFSSIFILTLHLLYIVKSYDFCRSILNLHDIILTQFGEKLFVSLLFNFGVDDAREAARSQPGGGSRGAGGSGGFEGQSQRREACRASQSTRTGGSSPRR